jgi:hypothetical protein
MKSTGGETMAKDKLYEQNPFHIAQTKESGWCIFMSNEENPVMSGMVSPGLPKEIAKALNNVYDIAYETGRVDALNAHIPSLS